jgi:hypothetical protein
MSMDLSVWSALPFELPNQLPQSQSWHRYPDEWCFESTSWVVSVIASVSSERDRPPHAVLQRLADASYVAHASLEPIAAGLAGYRFLEEVVRALARATSGVWVDPNGSAFAHDEGQLE